MTQTKITLDDLLKPRIMKCARCGGDLHVIPIMVDGKIETYSLCGKCTFHNDENDKDKSD